MESTPPSPESAPPREDDGVNKLLADIERIMQQMRAYNKRPLPATEEQVKKLIQNEKERPINVPAEKVVEHLMGKTEELVKQFQSIYNQFLSTLDKRTQSLKLELGTQAVAIEQAVKEVKASVAVVDAAADKIPSSVRVEGEVFGFTNRITFGGTVVVSALLGALLLSAFSSKVSKEDYEQLRAQNAALQVKKKQIDKEGVYYKNQIKKYKTKNPETTAFPVYEEAK